jgi:hypothetical protein
MTSVHPLTGVFLTYVIHIIIMNCSDHGSGNYGVPDSEFVSDFDDLELHYTWFTTMDDAIQYAKSIDNGSYPFKWSAFDGIITFGV